MNMDILAILMVAFGLFAILMFIVFYVFAKKNYNEKHMDNTVLDDNDDIELVNILIDNQEYSFDANNYVLKENDHVKVLFEDSEHDGVVTRANYFDDITNYNTLPTKLILKNKVSYQNVYDEEDDDDFIPVKKR